MNVYASNVGTIYLFRSGRKRAHLLGDIRVMHLISHESEGKIDDARIIDQFIGVADKILAVAEKDFYVNLSVVESRECIEYKTRMEKTQSWYWSSGLRTFTMPTELIHFIWFNLFCRIYPYNTVDFTEIEMDPSIKYMIEKWKEKGEAA